MATDYRQGDYRVVAHRLRPAAEQLVAWCAPTSGELVVDVAAGSGNVARLCRARGADVVAVDRVREQLLLGTADGGDGISWVAADAHTLPLRSGIASAALSTFGVIYAGEPEVAVAELGRICRPGGRIGLTAWADDGSQQAFTHLLRELHPTPESHDHLAVWGSPDRIRRQLSGVADEVEVRTGQLVARFPSIDDWWSARELTPPVASARAQLDGAAYADFGRRMREIALRFGDQGEDFVLRDDYLVALARAR